MGTVTWILIIGIGYMAHCLAFLGFKRRLENELADVRRILKIDLRYLNEKLGKMERIQKVVNNLTALEAAVKETVALKGDLNSFKEDVDERFKTKLNASTFNSLRDNVKRLDEKIFGTHKRLSKTTGAKEQSNGAAKLGKKTSKKS